VLGELSEVQREEYEEHYFDCAECAIDLKAFAIFTGHDGESLPAREAASSPQIAFPPFGGWLRWFQPLRRYRRSRPCLADYRISEYRHDSSGEG